jgi:hypothetical protein
VIEDHTIPVDRAPGSIPCDHCLGHLEDRIRFGLIGAPDGVISSPTLVWAAWFAFRDRPVEETWGLLVYRLAIVLGSRVWDVLGDIDPWPHRTEERVEVVRRLAALVRSELD